MPDAPSLEGLPPEGRFAVRAVAAGLSFDEVDRILRADGERSRNALRAAVRSLGNLPPPRAEGDAALRGALGPALDLARTPPSRRPATRCPSPDVARDLAAGRLDGPLLLAQAEHAADCPSCMGRLAAMRADAPGDGDRAAASGDEPPPPRRPPTATPTTYTLLLLVVVLLLLMFLLM